jgi:hypothetical protein
MSFNYALAKVTLRDVWNWGFERTRSGCTPRDGEPHPGFSFLGSLEYALRSPDAVPARARQFEARRPLRDHPYACSRSPR